MSRTRTIARRSFLIGSAAIAGGVAFGAYLVARPIPNPLLQGLAEGEAALTPFVRITDKGIILIVPRADVGQGIASLQAHLIAEELDIDPATATLDPGQPHAAYYNATVAADGLPFALYDDGRLARMARAGAKGVIKVMGMQITGGSSSTPDMHETLRRAGAVARETLKQAAAQRTGITRADLRTENAAVILPDGTTIAYVDLAGEAAAIDPVTDVTLRRPDQWRLLGQTMQRTDMVAKSTGAQVYGIDLRLPGMEFATVRRNPGIGGAVNGYDAGKAATMPGVIGIVPVTGGVGVIADNTWRAFRAAEAVQIDWAAPAYPATSDEMWRVLDAAHTDAHRNSRLRNDGDVDAALSQAAHPLSAEYRTPYLAHGALEPLSATVLYTADRLDIWTATQVPDVLRDRAAALAGLDPARVTLHLLHAGGSFGRRLDIDYVLPAVEIAMTRPGTPVQTTLSREEDMTHDFPRPMQLARCRGAVQDGRVAALSLDTIGPSVSESWFGRILFAPPGPDTLLVLGAYDQPYAIPDYRVTGYKAPSLVPVGSWRSPGACSNVFFHDTFLDELIHAAGADPLAERLRLIDHAPSRGVLEAVGEMCNWSGPALGDGRGRGIAYGFAHGVPVATVVDVTATDLGITIDAVWIAVDCGTVYDPVNAEAQVTGSTIWGLAHAMNCELTYEDHAPVQTNFDRFEGMRLHQTPGLSVRLLEQGPHVRGLGEPATATAAPALGNAIFAATGQRLREMPFSSSVTFA
ncbi:MAG: xanthine dehydrogenase family protein molybdopterin-binding subunit [Rhodobacterales bacterium]|nr:xanthine dehydrogenase family protein molybdopterin-binding subunit [Rhodobacterales bacterium]